MTTVSDVVHYIEDRIRQWSEFENSLEHLLAWLTEAEILLKNYSPKNTIEEKQEQLEKYQVNYYRIEFFFIFSTPDDRECSKPI